MKNITKILLFIFSIIAFGCSDDFLDTQAVTIKNASNFPKTESDLNQVLMSVYAAQRNGVNGGTTWPSYGMLLYDFLASDEWIVAGGLNDKKTRAIGSWKTNDVESTKPMWADFYMAIYRANFIFENYNDVTGLTEDQKNKILGQTYYLRGSCFFDLCRKFGKVPLTLKTEPENLPKASTEALFGQIASDLKKAIELLPSVSFATKPKSEYGLATKWASEALMARVFLFYTGYYNKSELPLAGGGTITKANVIAWLDDCIVNSGHGLVSDFRNLWPYSYLPKDTYKFNGSLNGFTNDTKWEGESGNNKEIIYSINLSVTGLDNTSGNITLQFAGQMYDLIPWGRGWGHMTPNPNLFASWPTSDLRRKATICDPTDPTEGVLNGTTGSPMNAFTYSANFYNQTGLFAKKASRINLKGTNGKFIGMCSIFGRTPNNGAMDLFQNIVTMRFSDVLLMAAELGSSNAQQYFNQVRSRAGLPSIPVTLDAIKAERMYEFSFEGIRFYDLLRWHDYEAATNALVDIPVTSLGVFKKISFAGRFRSETGGFLMIPNSQIVLSNGVLEQNPGWTNSNEYFYSGE